jgi:ABC-2 type transport system permease protein
MIGAAIRKDLALLRRDRGALLSLFALPVVFMLVFGAMFDADPARRRVIAIGATQAGPLPEASTEASTQALAGALTASLAFTPVRAGDAAAVWARVLAGGADAGIILGADRVELVIASALPEHVRAPLAGALEGLVLRALVPPDVQLPRIRVTELPAQPRAGPVSSFQISVPGNAVLFGFFLSLSVALSFAQERRTGTWRRLLAAPVPRWHALVALLVPYFFIGAVQLAFFFALGALGFGMEIAGSLAALIALSLALVYCAVALGLLFAAIGGSERQLGAFGSVALLVMGMVGGSMVPRQVMPAFMQSLGRVVPHGWALDGYHEVLVRAGTTLGDVLPSLAALLLFGTAFASIGLALFRFERV